MKLVVNDGRALNILVQSTGVADVLEPRVVFGTTENKLSDDGKVLLNARSLEVLKMENGQPVGLEKNVSVSLTEQPQGGLKFGQLYVLAGRVSVNHYGKDGGGVGVSIVADRVQPAKLGE